MFHILVVNIGSTSFKFQLFDMDEETALIKGGIERVGEERSPMKYRLRSGNPVHLTLDTRSGFCSCIQKMVEVLHARQNGVLKEVSDIDAVGFKAVHAGEIRAPSLIDEAVLSAMEEYASVVPAHNPPYIDAIRQFQKKLPHVPLVAVFESFFHQDIPEYACLYGVPYVWREEYQVKKYGFHGASHRFIMERTAQILQKPLKPFKLVSCHLGGSSSLCAIKDGQSVDTSMGFSAQAGISMSTRCGDLDPFVIPFVMSKANLSFSQVMEILAKKSGLLGISGSSGDVYTLEGLSAKGNPRAELALEVFTYSVKKYIGAFAAAMGGIEALAFAGGIGENAPGVRSRICRDLEFLGIVLDEGRNEVRGRESIISPEEAHVPVLVVPTNEELIVARETLMVITGQKGLKAD